MPILTDLDMHMVTICALLTILLLFELIEISFLAGSPPMSCAVVCTARADGLWLGVISRNTYDSCVCGRELQYDTHLINVSEPLPNAM